MRGLEQFWENFRIIRKQKYTLECIVSLISHRTPTKIDLSEFAQDRKHASWIWYLYIWGYLKKFTQHKTRIMKIFSYTKKRYSPNDQKINELLINSHSSLSRVGKGGWGVITECVRNEMLESRRETYTGCQGNTTVKIPELVAKQQSPSVLGMKLNNEKLLPCW